MHTVLVSLWAEICAYTAAITAVTQHQPGRCRLSGIYGVSAVFRSTARVSKSNCSLSSPRGHLPCSPIRSAVILFPGSTSIDGLSHQRRGSGSVDSSPRAVVHLPLSWRLMQVMERAVSPLPRTSSPRVRDMTRQIRAEHGRKKKKTRTALSFRRMDPKTRQQPRHLGKQHDLSTFVEVIGEVSVHRRQA